MSQGVNSYFDFPAQEPKPSIPTVLDPQDGPTWWDPDSSTCCWLSLVVRPYHLSDPRFLPCITGTKAPAIWGPAAAGIPGTTTAAPPALGQLLPRLVTQPVEKLRTDSQTKAALAMRAMHSHIPITSK